MGKKHIAVDTYYYVNNKYEMLIKLTANSTQNWQKTQKAKKDKRTSFPTESVEIADFYKHAIPTQE